MLRQIVLFLLCAASPLTGTGQQVLNLDFELPGLGDPSRPWGWAPAAWGDNVFTRDSATVSQGRFSLRAQTTAGTERPPALQLNLDPYFIAGKTIELRGSVLPQLTADTSTVAFGFGTVTADGAYSETTDTVFQTADHLGDWRPFAGSVAVPAGVTTVTLTITPPGEGTVHYDALELIMGGQSYVALPVADSFPATAITEIRAAVHPFDRLPDAGGPSVSFPFLRDAADSTRILALGESTHGTSEFFTLKDRVFRFAVTELGFRVFALEANQLACEPINRYVLGQTDATVEAAMSKLFAVWYTTEMRELIEWIRERNLRQPRDPVYFAGFDMQDHVLPLAALTDFLHREQPALLPELAGFGSFAENYFQASDSLKQHWQVRTRRVARALDRLPDTTGRYLLGRQYARLLSQFTEQVVQGFQSLYRDEAMAENISWLASTAYPGRKIFVWAHDVHVAKSNHPVDLHNLNQGVAMGQFLHRAFGEAYRAFGLLTYSGAYLAQRSYADRERIAAPLYPAPEGSLEAALHGVALAEGRENLFLDFGHLPSGLPGPLPFRFANHVAIEYGFFQKIGLARQFDGVFFMDRTHPSTYLGK